MTEELTYERRIIAFIDILGFKEIVRQSENDSVKITLLYSVLEYLKNWETSDNWSLKFVEIEEDAQKKGVTNFDIRGKTNTTAFSDSIVVSVKVSDNVNEMASTLIANLAYIGSILMEKGILFRGGLTIGNIIHNDNGTVFGQGLIDAYLLETKNAKYPRIVLSDKLVKELNYPLQQKRNRYPYHQYLNRFQDGCVGFHQMIYYQVIDSWVEMTNEDMIESLENISNVILKGLDSSFENSDVFEKYKWLKEQYNDLIILSDYDYVNKTNGNIKTQIRDFKEDHTIHYSELNKFSLTKNKENKA
jgi:hypothetical protein